MFYRVHWFDCPEFSPENAESIDWGLRGQDVMCPRCNGSGYIKRGEYEDYCPDCDGAGVVEAQPVPGYSCCESPEGLIKYFDSRVEPDDSETVIEFSGRIVGWGTDNEPLVIPDMLHVRKMTWAEFKGILQKGGKKV